MTNRENSASDAAFLSRALELASSRAGKTAPNPAVGAILVKDGQVLGEGFHRVAGEAHAEVAALAAAKGDVAGSTIYVSLEPCCHFGKTPPCTEAIERAAISRVVYGFQDPNPKVSGGGAAYLKSKGIEVEYLSHPGIEMFYRAYAHWTRTKKPFLVVKLAVSADGKTAGPDGVPVAITGAESGQWTHGKRSKVSSMLTSIRTVLRDNPLFTARLNGVVEKKTVYVLDRNLDLPLDCQLVTSSERLILLAAENASIERESELKKSGIRVLRHSGGLSEALSLIGAEGCHEIWAELGGTLFMQVLREELADEVHLLKGVVTIGEDGIGPAPMALNDALKKYRLQDKCSLGRDQLETYLKHGIV